MISKKKSHLNKKPRFRGVFYCFIYNYSVTALSSDLGGTMSI